MRANESNVEDHSFGTIQVRPSKSTEIDALVQIENRCFRSYYSAHKFDRRQFRYYLNRERTLAFSAVVAQELVGYILGYVTVRRNVAKAHIYSIAILKQYRRHQIGSRLTACFLREAKQRQCRCAVLEVAQKNHPAARMFTASGFAPTRIIADYYAKGVDGVSMVRVLESQQS